MQQDSLPGHGYGTDSPQTPLRHTPPTETHPSPGAGESLAQPPVPSKRAASDIAARCAEERVIVPGQTILERIAGRDALRGAVP